MTITADHHDTERDNTQAEGGTDRLTLAVSNLRPQPRPTVLICSEDGTGGLDVQLIGTDGLPRPYRLCAARAASLRQIFRGAILPEITG